MTERRRWPPHLKMELNSYERLARRNSSKEGVSEVPVKEICLNESPGNFISGRQKPPMMRMCKTL
jgi:hypothetical protein